MTVLSYQPTSLLLGLFFLGNSIVVDNDCFSSQLDCRKKGIQTGGRFWQPQGSHKSEKLSRFWAVGKRAV